MIDAHQGPNYASGKVFKTGLTLEVLTRAKTILFYLDYLQMVQWFVMFNGVTWFRYMEPCVITKALKHRKKKQDTEYI